MLDCRKCYGGNRFVENMNIFPMRVYEGEPFGT